MLSKVVTVICCLTYVAAEDPPSHLKPFGWGDSTPMEEVQGFLPVKQFFEGEINGCGVAAIKR